jgi:hypothetical protein
MATAAYTLYMDLKQEVDDAESELRAATKECNFSQTRFDNALIALDAACTARFRAYTQYMQLSRA